MADEPKTAVYDAAEDSWGTQPFKAAGAVVWDEKTGRYVWLKADDAGNFQVVEEGISPPMTEEEMDAEEAAYWADDDHA